MKEIGSTYFPIPSYIVPLLCTGAATIVLLVSLGLDASDGLVKPLMWAVLALQSYMLVWVVSRFWWKAGRNPFHPLVYICIFSVFPMNILQGLHIALGGTSSVEGILGSDLNLYFTKALAAACMGIGFMVLGFMAPIGERIAQRLQQIRVPVIASSRPGSFLAIMVVFLLGLLVSYALLAFGAYGSSLGEYDQERLGIISVLLPLRVFVPAALFLGAFYYRSWSKSLAWKVIMGGMTTAAIYLAMLSGGRSTLLYFCLIVSAGVCFSRMGAISIPLLSRIAVALVLALFLGVVFGSAFRSLRQDYGVSAQLTVQESFDLTANTSNELSGEGLEEMFSDFSDRFLERLTAMENFAVTLDRAESLKAQERLLHMDNNILKECLYAFIPRTLWPNKPIVSDMGLNFMHLYLDNVSRSWAGPSIFGDLYRNYGWMGIPVGMLLMGVYLRTIYERLIVAEIHVGFANMYYIFLLGTVGYEAGYSSYITLTIRITFSIILIWFVFFLFDALEKRKPALRNEKRMP